jgi:hypothetical protein
MGVMINIYYDKQTIPSDEMQHLAEGMRQIVSEVMAKKDVFVLVSHNDFASTGNNVEVFVQVNTLKVTNVAELTDKIAEAITTWKQENSVRYSINLNVIPVVWHAKLGL